MMNTAFDAKKFDVLMNEAVIWDMVTPFEPSIGNDLALVDRYIRAGHSFMSFTIAGDSNNISQAIQRLARFHSAFRAIADRAVFVYTVDDVIAAKKAGKIAVGLHFEGTNLLERNLEMIEIYYRLGIRFNLVAFNQMNSAGGGCGDLSDPGLSRFGRKVVEEMNRVGMIVDLSHVGYRTSMDAMEASSKPVVFTHSNSFVVQPHYRNIKDDQIKACAATGGVIGISGSSWYLGGEPTADIMARHIDHICSLVGPDHIGFGFDYLGNTEALLDYVKARPEEWPSINGERYDTVSYGGPELAKEVARLLMERGYKDADILKILGGNFMRVASENWR